jgi:hypothetical protein
MKWYFGQIFQRYVRFTPHAFRYISALVACLVASSWPRHASARARRRPSPNNLIGSTSLRKMAACAFCRSRLYGLQRPKGGGGGQHQDPANRSIRQHPRGEAVKIFCPLK